MKTVRATGNAALLGLRHLRAVAMLGIVSVPLSCAGIAGNGNDGHKSERVDLSHDFWDDGTPWSVSPGNPGSRTSPNVGAVSQGLNASATPNLWTNHTIPVCFETGLDEVYSTGYPGRTAGVEDFATYKFWIQEAVEDSWGRNADIRFVGWQDCASTNDSELSGWVTILWSNANGTTVGPQTNTWTRMGLVIPTYAPPAGMTLKEHFQGTVRHEMGHALGFEHELDRLDAPWSPTGGVDDCNYGQRDAQTTNYTTNDAPSVMNTSYCTAASAGRLSTRDIQGVRVAYGHKARGSLVGYRGRCLDVANASTTYGDPLLAYDCYGQSNDRWHWNKSLETLSAHYDTSGNYLAGVPLPLNQYGTDAVLASPSSSLTHELRWRFNSVRWKGLGGLCVEPASSPASNVLLVMNNCDYSLAEWDFLPDSRIRLSGTNYCANVLGAGTSDGTYLGLYPCSSGTPYVNEVFDFSHASGSLLYGGKCVDVWGGEPDVGASLRLYTCSTSTPHPNERFYASGLVHSAASSESQCLDIMGGLADNGTLVEAYPCDSQAKNQMWDFHW